MLCCPSHLLFCQFSSFIFLLRLASVPVPVLLFCACAQFSPPSLLLSAVPSAFLSSSVFCPARQQSAFCLFLLTTSLPPVSFYSCHEAALSSSSRFSPFYCF
ncbi:hypothetical protein EV1_032020 [Malus domestica]